MDKIEKTTDSVIPAAETSKGIIEKGVDNLANFIKGKGRDEVLCTATKIPLYFIKDDGFKGILNSFGKCDNCDNLFHTSYLRTNGAAMAPWAIEYIGYWCNTCWGLPESEWSESTEPDKE
jgi:hypothetical protein